MAFYGRGVKLKGVGFQGVLGQFYSFTPLCRSIDKKLKKFDVDKFAEFVYFMFKMLGRCCYGC